MQDAFAGAMQNTTGWLSGAFPRCRRTGKCNRNLSGQTKSRRSSGWVFNISFWYLVGDYDTVQGHGTAVGQTAANVCTAFGDDDNNQWLMPSLTRPAPVSRGAAADGRIAQRQGGAPIPQATTKASLQCEP
jgi:hypothetical protein